ncbi:hypothetical protein BLNAU_13704 [Blattamonas nauphoetae]|uniref:RRM domain-containing protein n=1 Tax=Blattamonas nauphoetae TaxID=2049346 RepID=A0ABQ9XMG8_9EUKA|nr:hypothetical protein BLNAU_13704 [Blattamonas nauphoetae]
MAQQPGLTVRFSIQNSKPTHGTAPESGSASRPDIILNLFPTSVITNLKINSSLPGQPVTAVVHFKEEREAQQAISQSGSLTYLQNRIEVSVNREKPGHQNKPSPFSHGPVPVKVVSPPPQPIPPMPGGDPSTYGSKPQPGPRPYQGPPQPGGNPSTYGSKPQPVSGGNRTTNGFKPPPPPRVNVTQNICPLTNRQISRRACLRGEPNVIYEAEALQSFVSENGMSPTTFESMSLGDIQFM